MKLDAEKLDSFLILNSKSSRVYEDPVVSKYALTSGLERKRLPSGLLVGKESFVKFIIILSFSHGITFLNHVLYLLLIDRKGVSAL